MSIYKKESDMFPILKTHLSEKGYRVYSEVSNPVAGNCRIDCVARRDNIVEAYEMKLSLTWKVIEQANRAHLVCDKIYCVVSTKPINKRIEECKKYGIGIIQIKDNQAIEILNAKQTVPIHTFQKRLLERLEDLPEGTEAGIPCLKGVGETYRIINDIKEHLKKDPKATWRDLYYNVKNSYSNYKSMANALYIWRGFSLKKYKNLNP